MPSSGDHASLNLGQTTEQFSDTGTLRVLGAIAPTNDFPSFATPVFGITRDSERYLQEIGSNGKVEGFDRLPDVESHTTLLSAVPIDASTEVGANALFAFAFSAEAVYVGQRDNLKRVLADSVHRFADNPFLFVDVASFFDDTRLMLRALWVAWETMRNSNGKELADAWYFSACGELFGRTRSPLPFSEIQVTAHLAARLYRTYRRLLRARDPDRRKALGVNAAQRAERLFLHLSRPNVLAAMIDGANSSTFSLQNGRRLRKRPEYSSRLAQFGISKRAIQAIIERSAKHDVEQFNNPMGSILDLYPAIVASAVKKRNAGAKTGYPVKRELREGVLSLSYGVTALLELSGKSRRERGPLMAERDLALRATALGLSRLLVQDKTPRSDAIRESPRTRRSKGSDVEPPSL